MGINFTQYSYNREEMSDMNNAFLEFRFFEA